MAFLTGGLDRGVGFRIGGPVLKRGGLGSEVDDWEFPVDLFPLLLLPTSTHSFSASTGLIRAKEFWIVLLQPSLLGIPWSSGAVWFG